MELTLTFSYILAVVAVTAIEFSIPKNVRHKMAYMPLIDGAPLSPLPAITNGRQASRGQFPHQVGLFLGSSFCGGSVISPSWILTAAHCTEGVSSATAYIGSQNLYANEPGKVTTVSRTIIEHEHYNDPVFLANDVALIRIVARVAVGCTRLHHSVRTRIGTHEMRAPRAALVQRLWGDDVITVAVPDHAGVVHVNFIIYQTHDTA